MRTIWMRCCCISVMWCGFALKKEVFRYSNCKCLWKASSVLVKLLLVSLTSGFTSAEHWGLGWFFERMRLLHIVTLNFIFTILPKVYLNKYFMTSKIAHLASLFYICLSHSILKNQSFPEYFIVHFYWNTPFAQFFTLDFW